MGEVKTKQELLKVKIVPPSRLPNLKEVNRNDLAVVEGEDHKFRSISLGTVIDSTDRVTALQIQRTIKGDAVQIGGEYWSSWKENVYNGGYYYDIIDERIGLNSFVEIIPNDSDVDIILAMGVKSRINIHPGLVRVFANKYPYMIEEGRDLEVNINIYNHILKESEYLLEWFVGGIPSDRIFGFYIEYDSIRNQHKHLQGGLSPFPTQSSTKPIGSTYYKYFIFYYENLNKVEVSGNVSSITINGNLIDTIISYDETYNYTIFEVTENPFPPVEGTHIPLQDLGILPVKIIFNE